MSGTLPITIPRPVGQVPIHHGQRNGNGHRQTTADIHKRASLAIAKSGKWRGNEFVELYAGHAAIGATLPAQQLIGLARVDLEPGASKTASYVVPMSPLAFTGTLRRPSS